MPQNLIINFIQTRNVMWFGGEDAMYVNYSNCMDWLLRCALCIFLLTGNHGLFWCSLCILYLQTVDCSGVVVHFLLTYLDCSGVVCAFFTYWGTTDCSGVVCAFFTYGGTVDWLLHRLLGCGLCIFYLRGTMDWLLRCGLCIFYLRGTIDCSCVVCADML